MRAELLEHLTKITAEEKAILDGKSINRSIYMESGGRVVNAKKLLDAGKLISIRPHTRFAHFPEHRHDYIEMVYMCRGQTTHIINGKRVLLCEGETLILGQHAVQEILPAGEDDIAVNFIILPQFFDKALEMLNEEETPLRRFILDCIAGRDDMDGFLHFKTADVPPIQNLIENLIYTLVYGMQNKRKTNEITMGLLLLQFINNSDKLGFSDSEQGVIARTLKYIEENYRDGSLSEVAELLHYDLYWLSREIKRKTGKTYTELLQEKRLSQAAYLLANTTIKVVDIAESVGYNNISYFHKIFADRFGMSPKKYRDRGRVSGINN